MKKENKVLIKFLSLMAAAVFIGIVAGRMGLPLSQGQIFLPQIIYFGPVLIVLAVFMIFLLRRKNKPEQVKRAAITGFTGLGAVLSGLCGFYTVTDVPFLIICTLLTAAVVIMAALLQDRDKKIHTGNMYTSLLEKGCAIIFFCMVFLSAFIPAGPLPALLAGFGWLFCAVERC